MKSKMSFWREVLNLDRQYYKIDEVAQKTGLTKRAIRYYEEFGLVEPKRNQCSYRMYDEEDLEKLMRIAALRIKIGFTVNEIKDYFQLEKDIHSFFNSDTKNKKHLEKYIDDVNLQIKNIENREATLEKLKEKYNTILKELEKFK